MNLPINVRSKIRFKRVVEGMTACWEWQGSVTGTGHPRVNVGENQYGARKWIYERYRGKTEENLRSLCGTVLCVNPNHLEPIKEEKRQIRVSGGSFNYLCYQEADDDLMNSTSDLQDMAEDLEEEFPDSQAAKDESVEREIDKYERMRKEKMQPLMSWAPIHG